MMSVKYNFSNIILTILRKWKVIISMDLYSYKLSCNYSKLPIICVRIIQFADYPCTALCTTFFSQMQIRELGFRHLFVATLVGGGVLVLGGSAEDVVEQYLFSSVHYGLYRVVGWWREGMLLVRLVFFKC
jgi:hypothetical protein